MKDETCEKKCCHHSIWKIIAAVIGIVGVCTAIWYFTCETAKAETNHMELSYGCGIEPVTVMDGNNIRTGYKATMVHGALALYLSEKCKVSCEAKESYENFLDAWEKKDLTHLYPKLDVSITHSF